MNEIEKTKHLFSLLVKQIHRLGIERYNLKKMHAGLSQIDNAIAAIDEECLEKR